MSQRSLFDEDVANDSPEFLGTTQRARGNYLMQNTRNHNTNITSKKSNQVQDVTDLGQDSYSTDIMNKIYFETQERVRQISNQRKIKKVSQANHQNLLLNFLKNPTGNLNEMKRRNLQQWNEFNRKGIQVKPLV